MDAVYFGPASGVVLEDELLRQLWRFLQVAALALVAGWTAERVLDSRTGTRGVSLLCGLGGLWIGSWATAAGGWSGGPAVAGHAVLPAFAGAFLVSGLIRLVTLGVAGPRR
jgi:hypothetical protein